MPGDVEVCVVCLRNEGGHSGWIAVNEVSTLRGEWLKYSFAVFRKDFDFCSEKGNHSGAEE